MTTEIKIEGMSCVNCVRHVTEAIFECENVQTVTVDLEKKTAAIEHDAPVSLDDIRKAVEEAGYEVV